MRTTFNSLLFALLLGAFSPTLLVAQSEIEFGDPEYDGSLPVEITADNFKVSQNESTTEFSGDVLIKQGEMIFSADYVMVTYVAVDGENTGEISELIATGGVTVVFGGEAAEADEATYSIEKGNVVMRGDVLLTQGKSALSGQLLTIELASGLAEMSGRVKTVFHSE